VKIALFDSINETHVCQALEDALRALGHDVLATGALWHGHRPPAEPSCLQRIDAALDRILAERCDALVNFRASTLSTGQLARLRDAGMTTAVWLPDDPVLYGVAYGAVVDHYDLALHCGNGAVLRFYDDRGHRSGVNFPFWVDPARWPAGWNPHAATEPLVFLGNLHGPAKKDRYRQLAPAAGNIAVYGRCGDDPAGIHRGELHGIGAISANLPRFFAGLSIAQRFADYAGTPYDFAGLAGLGHFELPSRVIEYASLGLPVLVLGTAPSEHFPEMARADDVQHAVALSNRLAAAPDEAMALSARGRRRVVAHFSGAARARFLSALLSGQAAPARMDLAAREFSYLEYQGELDDGP
jgi:hypothetical protein